MSVLLTIVRWSRKGSRGFRLLEPKSNSSLYEHRDYASLVVLGQDFFVLRIVQECSGERR